MMIAEQLDEKIDDIRQEILFAIKERISAITGGSLHRTIELKDLIIRSGDADNKKLTAFFILYNIFLDDNNELCGDLYGEKTCIENGIIFGKNLEAMKAEELQMVLDRLYSDQWTLIDDGFEDESQKMIYVAFLKKYFTVPRFFRQGA